MPGQVLSAEEREEIRVGIDRGDSLADVALSLGRPTSTVSREVKRNGGAKGYCAVRAHRRAARQRARPRPTMFDLDPVLSGRVADQLAKKDSPMTIAIAEGISHESIYQGIYANGRRGLAAGLGRHLHRRRRRRKARLLGGAVAKKASPLGHFKGIALRPVAALEREEVGHIEGDLIIGQGGASAIVTLIDRASSFSMLGSLQDGHTADQVVRRTEQLLRRLPPEARLTLTWDQGREMAHWAQLEELSGVSVYFADPHAPWMRPVNENFNGLVRRWLPKGTNLSIYTQDDLEAIAMQINSMPRRSLGWDCAYKLHYDALVALTG
jgi:transposase, IS30 family